MAVENRVLSDVIRTFEIAPQKTVTEEYLKEAGMVWIGDSFKKHFLGLKISPNPKTKLAIRKLEENSLDKSIIDELGNKAEISISQFHAFLSANRESTEWFIFYMKGKNGKLCVVNARWVVNVDSWRVDALSVADPCGWAVGYQVVSQV